MASPIHMLEFLLVDGSTLYQRVDQLGSIIETTKDGRKIIHLLLANNNRVQVIGETKESINRRITIATSAAVVVIARDPEPEPEPAVEAEPA